MSEYTTALIPAVWCVVCEWGPCKYMRGYGGILTNVCGVPKENRMREIRERHTRDRVLFTFDD